MTDNVKLVRNLFGSMQQSIFLGDPIKEGRFACFREIRDRHKVDDRHACRVWPDGIR